MSAYRHELKYTIGIAEYEAIKRRVGTVMKTDPHTDSSGRYVIHSIYFDNFNDKALREKINGVQKREKFRIRYYNEDLSHISLEKKIKNNNLCMKLGTLLTIEECEKIINGDTEFMRVHKSELVRELYCKMKAQLLQPRVRVSYIREPYVFAVGNVRVTFDFNIRTSLYDRNFFEPAADINPMDTPSDIIMEVKYDAFLPDVIRMLIQTEGVRQSAFSKYGISRRFG